MAPKEMTDDNDGGRHQAYNNDDLSIVSERSALLAIPTGGASVNSSDKNDYCNDNNKWRSKKKKRKKRKSSSGSSKLVHKPTIKSATTATTAILSFSLLIQSYLLVSVFPYSGFLAMHLIPNLTEETAGISAGYIASAFMFGRMFSSFEWGKIADKYGRVFVIKISFALSAIFSILFGLSSTFHTALFFRCLLGVSNGLIGPIKTMVSEYSHGDKQKETHMMAIVMGMWGYGFLINPAVSGYLSDPCKQYPNLDLGDAITDTLEEYPFLLPNILGSLLCVIAYFLVDNYVEETLPEHKRQPFTFQSMFPCCSKFFNKNNDNNMLIRNVSSWGLFKHLHNEDGEDSENMSAAMISSPSFNKEKERRERQKIMNDIVLNDKYYDDDEDRRDFDYEKDENKKKKNDDTDDEIEKPATIRSLLARNGTRKLLVVYCFFSFLNTVVDEVFPLYCMSKTSGLGIEEKVIGKIMSATGLCYVMVQYFLVTSLSSKFGTFNALRIGSVFSIPLVCFLPISLVTNRGSSSSGSLSWSTLIYISVLYAVVRTFSSVVFSTITITLNQSVPTYQRATMNGLSMLGGSLAKGFGPIFGGTLFSLSVNHILSPYGSVFTYCIVSILGLCLAGRVVFFMKEEDDDDDDDDSNNNYGVVIDAAIADNKATTATIDNTRNEQQKPGPNNNDTATTKNTTKEEDDKPISF